MATIIPKRQAEGQRYIAQGGRISRRECVDVREEGMRPFSGKMTVLEGRRHNLSDVGMHLTPSRTNDFLLVGI
jgi:hypothetical protein